MNRFLTHTGRQPIWLDDLDFIQDSIQDEIKKLVQGIVGMTNDPVILSGCDVTENEDGTFQVSDGVIYYGGHLLRLAAGSYPTTSRLAILTKDNYDETGNRILMDSGEEVRCYRCTTAYLGKPKIIQGKPSTEPNFKACVRLDDIIRDKNKIVLLYSAVHTITDIDRTGTTGYDSTCHCHIYRGNGNYYCDISCYSRGFDSHELSGVINQNYYTNDDYEKLGGESTIPSYANFWSKCVTMVSMNLCYGNNQDKVIPCTLLFRTYISSDDSFVWKCKFIPSETIPLDTPVMGGAHFKLNTL